MGKDKGEGGKRTRKLKDTNAPRKAVSAFMLWSQTERTNVKNANPDMDFGNIGRKMGELWRELPAEEKAKWQATADKDKERYQREAEVYQKSPLYHQFQAIKSQGKGRGGIKQEGQPKRATTAYMYFTAEERSKVKEEFPDITFGDIGKKIGERWKALSAEDKKPYEAKAERDRKRYEVENSAFQAKLGRVGDEAGHDDDDGDDDDDDAEDDDDDE